MRGDPSKLYEATSWRPEVTLETTLRDVLAHWESLSV